MVKAVRSEARCASVRAQKAKVLCRQDSCRGVATGVERGAADRDVSGSCNLGRSGAAQRHTGSGGISVPKDGGCDTDSCDCHKLSRLCVAWNMVARGVGGRDEAAQVAAARGVARGVPHGVAHGVMTRGVAQGVVANVEVLELRRQSN